MISGFLLHSLSAIISDIFLSHSLKWTENCGITEDRICQDKCLPPCEHWTYIFNETGSIFCFDGQIISGMSINLYVKDYTYIIFQDQFEITFNSLLASLGGALGICLGLDVRFVIWIIFTPVMATLGFILNRILKKTGSLFSQAKAEKLKKFAAHRWVQQIAHIVVFPESDKAMLDDVFQSQAKMTKWLINVLLWTIYYVIGFGLTCKMCTDFYLEFRAVPTDFTYQMMQNDSFQLAPSLTICLPLAVTCLPVTDFKSEEFQSGFNNVTRKLTKDTDQLLNNSAGWSADFLLMTLSYLALYSDYEQLDNGNACIQSSFGILPGNSFFNIFDLYDERLKKANMTINKLKQKCGQEMRKNFIINSSQYYAKNETYGKFKTLEIGETTFISETKVCYNLPICEFFSTADYIEITIGTYLSDAFQEVATFLDVSGSISFDFLNRDYTNFDSATTTLLFDSTILVEFGDSITSRISIDDFYQALPVSNGTQKCSDEITLEDCQNECRIKAIRTACDCTPVSWPKLNNLFDSKDCNLEQYRNCSSLADNDTLTLLTSCIENCFPFCTRIRYSDYRTLDYNSPVIRKAQLLISMESLSFRLEQEYISFGFIDFVGAFGGALGFWIGLDVLMIVHFFYSLCATVIQCYFLITKYLGTRTTVMVVSQREREGVRKLKNVRES